MSKKLTSGTRLYPIAPREDDIKTLENRICEDWALAQRYSSELTADAATIMDGLTSDQKKYYHIRGTTLYLAGIHEGLRLLLGDDPAELFMQRAKAKHERVQKERDERRKQQRQQHKERVAAEKAQSSTP